MNESDVRKRKERKEAEESKDKESMDTLSHNYNWRSELEADDPVALALKEFNGTETNRRYWRWYFRKMCEREKDSMDAVELFTNWMYDIKREIVVDGMPDKHGRFDHIWARTFHKYLKAKFAKRYGRIYL